MADATAFLEKENTVLLRNKYTVLPIAFQGHDCLGFSATRGGRAYSFQTPAMRFGRREV
jgi:hypothetical protein